jgi:hypothetical protein
MLQICPQLAEVRKAVSGDSEPTAPPDIFLFSEFGVAITRIVDNVEESQIAELFDAIEDYMRNGDENVGAAVATGLLEALLNESSAKRFDFQKVSRFLGDRTKEYCVAWDRFTGCNTPGLR